MRVERIGYFVEVARSGSLRAAAARIGIAQSSLGEQVTALEEELDVVLIERTRRGVRLTSAGQEILPYAVHLLDAERDLVDAAASVSGAAAGTVRVGSTPMITATAVIPVISELRKQFPRINISVREGPSTDLERLIQTGAIDFALCTTPLEPPPRGVARRHLAAFPVAAYVPAHHELAGAVATDWATLARYDLVTMREGTTLWHLLHGRIPRPHIAAEADSMHSLCLMVESGIGVGVGVAPLAPALDSTGKWVPIQHESRTIRTSISSRTDAPLPRTARIVRDALAAPHRWEQE